MDTSIFDSEDFKKIGKLFKIDYNSFKEKGFLEKSNDFNYKISEFTESISIIGDSFSAKVCVIISYDGKKAVIAGVRAFFKERDKPCATLAYTIMPNFYFKYTTTTRAIALVIVDTIGNSKNIDDFNLDYITENNLKTHVDFPFNSVETISDFYKLYNPIPYNPSIYDYK